MATRGGFLRRFAGMRRQGSEQDYSQRLKSLDIQNDVQWPKDYTRDASREIQRKEYKVPANDLSGQVERATDIVERAQLQVTPIEIKKMLADIIIGLGKNATIHTPEKIVLDALIAAYNSLKSNEKISIELLYENIGEAKRQLFEQYGSYSNMELRQKMTPLISPAQRLSQVGIEIQNALRAPSVPIDDLTILRLKVRDAGASLSTKDAVMVSVRENLRKVTRDLVNVVKTSNLPY